MTENSARPPFRADHVGSLLRPDAVKVARLNHYDDNGVAAESLREIENEAIRGLVGMQESVGLNVVTDGEARRSFWHYDFMDGLTGFDVVERSGVEGVSFHGATLRPLFPTISGELDFPDDHPMLEHFRYLASVAHVCPKISIPGPSACHFRTAREDIAPAKYADTDQLFADLARTYSKAVKAFYAAGCRYLQMDDIFFAYLCDPKLRAEKKNQGEDPDWLIDRYAWMMNEAIHDRPDDLTIGMHMCRGNFQSTWVAEGAYDPVADTIFNKIDVDVYFMEYDSERAGSLSPLRLLPKGRKRVMPGFISTKFPELETADDIQRRFDDASQYADLDQLGIAPQCGFASTEEGNKITADDQWRKLELLVTVADKIWGEH